MATNARSRPDVDFYLHKTIFNVAQSNKNIVVKLRSLNNLQTIEDDISHRLTPIPKILLQPSQVQSQEFSNKEKVEQTTKTSQKGIYRSLNSLHSPHKQDLLFQEMNKASRVVSGISISQPTKKQSSTGRFACDESCSERQNQPEGDDIFIQLNQFEKKKKLQSIASPRNLQFISVKKDQLAKTLNYLESISQGKESFTNKISQYFSSKEIPSQQQVNPNLSKQETKGMPSFLANYQQDLANSASSPKILGNINSLISENCIKGTSQSRQSSKDSIIRVAPIYQQNLSGEDGTIIDSLPQTLVHFNQEDDIIKPACDSSQVISPLSPFKLLDIDLQNNSFIQETQTPLNEQCSARHISTQNRSQKQSGFNSPLCSKQGFFSDKKNPSNFEASFKPINDDQKQQTIAVRSSVGSQINLVNKLPSSETQGTEVLINPMDSNQNDFTLGLTPSRRNNPSYFGTNPNSLAGTFSSAMSRSTENKSSNKQSKIYQTSRMEAFILKPPSVETKIIANPLTIKSQRDVVSPKLLVKTDPQKPGAVKAPVNKLTYQEHDFGVIETKNSNHLKNQFLDSITKNKHSDEIELPESILKLSKVEWSKIEKYQKLEEQANEAVNKFVLSPTLKQTIVYSGINEYIKKKKTEDMNRLKTFYRFSFNSSNKDENNLKIQNIVKEIIPANEKGSFQCNELWSERHIKTIYERANFQKERQLVTSYLSYKARNPAKGPICYRKAPTISPSMKYFNSQRIPLQTKGVGLSNQNVLSSTKSPSSYIKNERPASASTKIIDKVQPQLQIKVVPQTHKRYILNMDFLIKVFILGHVHKEILMLISCTERRTYSKISSLTLIEF